MMTEERKGLWYNIHAKRERIKHGSGEHMRKPGSKGAPTQADFKNSQTEETKKPETSDHAHASSKHIKTPQDSEKQSVNSSDADSRFDGSTSLANTYKSETPGQIVKRVVKEALYHGKEVPLNKPMKGDVKKSKVYVKDPETGNVKKVNFGDKHLSIKKDIPARKRSYCARSSGQGNLTKKTSANYWSRRAWNC